MKYEKNFKKAAPRPYKPGTKPAGRPDFRREIERTLQRAGKRGASLKYLQDQVKLRRHQTEAFMLILVGMVQKGEIVQKKDRYFAKENQKTAEAVVVKVADGFGFVRPDDGTEDVFIPGRFFMGALPDDRVKIVVRQGRGNLMEGEVLAILQQSDYRFSGVFRTEQGLPVVYPDAKLKGPLQVMKGATAGAKDGQKVLAHIVKRGQRHFDHRVEIVSVFGASDQASVCCEAILADNGIVKEFPEEVILAAKQTQSKGIEQKEIDGRLDLRADVIFTIDGADTKDIDDAISLTRHENGWHLGVHIADVSHYVRAKSPLDEEAFRRGTSVYYANSVIPMLPPELSNGICSLNPDEDRLAFSALLSLDQKGNLIGYDFQKSVIRSKIKGVYSEINQILAGTADETIQKKYNGLEKTLQDMQELASILTARRFERGALDLESSEAKILIGEDGRVTDILPRARGESEQMIEEFMLVANEAAATFGIERNLPFLYRIHEDPSAEKLEKLSQLLTVLGLDTSDVKPGVQPSQMQKILAAVKGTDTQMLVNAQLLRSMAKAKYSEINKGHFGLVLKRYSHFTSPIRRYPDLVIHRIMSDSLKGLDEAAAQKRYGKFVVDAAVYTSTAEQRAMTVERNCEDCYKAEYMTSHIGERFEGIVSGITERGMFVELPNTVEGMILIAQMPGHYEFDGKIEVKDSVSQQSYRIGDRIRIQVVKADVSSGDVDFILDEPEQIKENQ